MTRFSDDDRDRIRAELVEAGRDLFARHGFDRTRVRDVTEAVGIGTSTFYQFFDAKEDLYLAVLLVERDRIHDRLDAAAREADTPRAEAETVLRTMFAEVRSSPLTRRLFVDGEIRLVEAQLDGATRDPDAPEAPDRTLPQIDAWVDRDEFRLDDPETVAGLFRSLLLVTQAQDTPLLPPESYEAIEDRLIETIVDGLFDES